MATVAVQTGRASVELQPDRVREPVATGSDEVPEQPDVGPSRLRAPATARVMTRQAWLATPVWREEQLAGQAGPPACLAETIPPGRSRPLSWRTRICPDLKMNCVFSQPPQRRRDAGASVRRMRRPLRLRLPEAARKPVWVSRDLLHFRRERSLNGQAPWQPIRDEAPLAPALQPLSHHREQPVSPALLPASKALPSWKSCRRLYRGDRANCRDCPVCYLIPDPSGSHQTLTSHRQVLRPRC